MKPSCVLLMIKFQHSAPLTLTIPTRPPPARSRPPAYLLQRPSGHSPRQSFRHKCRMQSANHREAECPRISRTGSSLSKRNKESENMFFNMRNKCRPEREPQWLYIAYLPSCGAWQNAVLDTSLKMSVWFEKQFPHIRLFNKCHQRNEVVNWDLRLACDTENETMLFQVRVSSMLCTKYLVIFFHLQVL